MTISDAAELKKLLKALGFEVYRTSIGRVLLAERVRDNLIMDSGIAVEPEGGYGSSANNVQVSVTLRAQASHFPGASVAQLQTEARALAKLLLDRGYSEDNSSGQEMLDPGDPTQVLDTSHELQVSRLVSEQDLQAELRWLLKLPRSSTDD